MRVAALAREAGAIVVPHLWKTGISIAAALHMAAVTPHCPLIEFLPAETADSAIRRELLTRDFGSRTASPCPRHPASGSSWTATRSTAYAAEAERLVRGAGVTS